MGTAPYFPGTAVMQDGEDVEVAVPVAVSAMVGEGVAMAKREEGLGD